MRCPCKGCENRTVTCHAVCHAYEEWKIEYQAMKDDLRENNALFLSDHSLRVHWNNLKRGNRKYAVNKKAR